MSPKPRVAIDAHVLGGKHQGSSTYLANTLIQMALRPLRYDLILYCNDIASAIAQLGATPFEYVPLNSKSPMKRLTYELPLRLKRDNIDLAIYQYISPPLSRSKSALIIHDILPITHPEYFKRKFRIPWQFALSLSLQKTNSIITVSEYSRRSLSNYNRDYADMTVVGCNAPSVIDRGKYSTKSNLVPRGRYVLSVGRVEPRKNVELLVSAFIKASVPGLTLVIVGKVEKGYNFIIPQRQDIIHLSDVGDQALYELYASASLFVYPSAAEGFGIPLLDALVLGLPTISSDQTAMLEVGSGSAHYFDPRQSDATTQLSIMISDHFTRAPLSAPTFGNRERLMERYNWSRNADAFELFIEKALARLGC